MPRLMPACSAEIPAVDERAVDISDHVRYFAHHLLEDLGCNVLEAANATEALALLDKQTVDIVFSDIVMPGESGFQLAEKISVRYPGLPALLASGHSSKQLIPQNERKFPILRKPYKLHALAAALADLISKVARDRPDQRQYRPDLSDKRR